MTTEVIKAYPEQLIWWKDAFGSEKCENRSTLM